MVERLTKKEVELLNNLRGLPAEFKMSDVDAIIKKFETESGLKVSYECPDFINNQPEFFLEVWSKTWRSRRYARSILACKEKKHGDSLGETIFFRK